MATTITVSEARATLPQILERVRAGEEVTLTRHGEPVAVVVRPDVLRARRAEVAIAAAAVVREVLEQGRASSLGEGPGIDEAKAEELLAEIRTARADR